MALAEGRSRYLGLFALCGYIGLGPRFQVNRNLFLDVTLMEGLLNDTNDLDIGMTFNLTWRP